MKRSLLLLVISITCAITISAQNNNFKDWITSVVIDSSGRMYAGTSQNGNGIYYSTDGGAHWQQTMMRYGVTAMTLTKQGTLISFAYGHGFGRYLFRLKNNGSLLDSVALSFTPASIVSSPAGVLFATSFGEGVFTSSDDGAQWSKINSDLNPLYIFQAISVSKNGLLVVAARTGVYRSSDSGAHWVKSSGIYDSTTVRHIITGSNGKMYAGGFESMMYRANVLFVSSDSGKSWKTQGKLRPDLDAMTVDSLGNIYVGSNKGVHRVSSNGDTTYVGLGGVAVDGIGIRTVALSNNKTIFAGAWGGVYRSTNGGADWEFFNNGMISDTANGNFSNPLPFGAYITCGVVARNGTIIVGTDSAGIFRSVDKGKTWLQTDLTVPNVTGLTMDSLGTVFAGTLENGVYYSNSSGASWVLEGNEQIKYRKVHSVAAVKAWIPRFGNDSLNMLVTHIIHAGTDDGVYYRYNVPFFMWNPSGYINGTVHALTSFAKTGEVYTATDDGAVWLRLGGWWYWVPQGNVGSHVSAMVCDSSETLFAVGPRGMFRSTDRGVTWVQKNFGIKDTNLISVALTCTGTLFAGSYSSGDIYRSTDKGEKWEKFASLSYPVRCLILDATENMYASAAGRFFMYSAAITTVLNQHEKVPQTFLLEQNFPNPFNPMTTIRFSVSTEGMVSLNVYDILGRKITSLLHGDLAPGEYSVPFNAVGFSSGVYLYRLSAGGISVTKRMILMK